MSTPEGRVKDVVKKILKRFENVYYHMPVQNGMGEPTLDFIGSCNGHFFAIETKAPGKKPTERQQLTMGNMLAGGAVVFVVDDDASAAVMRTTLQFMGGTENEKTNSSNSVRGPAVRAVPHNRRGAK